VTKTCKTCGEEKELSEFHPHRTSKGGHIAHCKPCVSAYRKSKYDTTKSFEQLLKSKYRISLDDYNSMLASQDSKCAICSTSEPGKYHGRLCVDHDHITGAVRGLLCHNCNTALGHFRDSIPNLLKAVSYLQN
jgi:hypothetical protein